MKGIKMSDCRFYVNEAARTVICVIPHTHDLLDGFIRDNCSRSDISLYDSIYDWKMLNMPNSFMGKAVCAPDDEWDEEEEEELETAPTLDEII